MKCFIYYRYFNDEEIWELIRNNSNNENWPRANTYCETLKKWNVEFERQQDIVRDYVDFVKNKKEGTDSFLIRVKNIINQKLKIIRDPDFKYLKVKEIDSYNYGKWEKIPHPYGEPDLTSEITPTQREREIKSLKEGYDIFVKENRKFTDDWAKTKLEKKIDLKQTLREFWKWNNNRRYPIAEVSDILDEWKKNIEKEEKEFPKIKELKTFEIELKERTKDTITFVWNVAEIDIPDYSKGLKDSKGNPLSEGWIKRVVIPGVSNFLFLFNNQYYEVLDWEQTSIGRVEIVAELSIFYNYYYYLIKSSVNGILHQSPAVKSEICSCAEFDRATHYYDFVSDYKLELELYKSEISGSGQTIFYGGTEEKYPASLPMIHGISLKRVGSSLSEIRREVQSIDWKKFWNDAWNAFSGISISGFSLGQGRHELGVLYYLLNNKLTGYDEGNNSRHHVEGLMSGIASGATGLISPLGTVGADQAGIIEDLKKRGIKGSFTNQEYHHTGTYEWREIEYQKTTKGGKYVPSKNGVGNILGKLWGLTNEDGTTNPNMRHFLEWHVHADLYWRKKEIWKGRYWLLHDGQTTIDELTNASGNTITILSPDIIIAKMTESITAKLGLSPNGVSLLNVAVDVSLSDDKGQNQRNTERRVVSDTKTSKGDEKHSESITKTVSPISGGNNKPNIQTPNIQPFLFGNDHTKSEYTFLQFQNRWMLSGIYPLTMRVSFNENLLNQYRNRKELKGTPGYDYFNTTEFWDILNYEGFLQASIISWNLNIPYADWFRTKIEAGVYIYRDNYRSFYEKKISSPLSFASKGGVIRGMLNTICSQENLGKQFGEDRLVHVDGMSWVWKDSFCCLSNEEGEKIPRTDVFPKLMHQMRHNLKVDDVLAWKFDGYTNGTATIKLPTQAEGQWYLWWLVAFTREESLKKPAALEFRCADEKGLEVILNQNGAKWSLEIKGNVEWRNIHGDPERVPQLGQPSADPHDPAGGKPTPFNPMTPMPTATLIEPDPLDGGLGGDPELEPPELEEETEKEGEKEEEEEQEKEEEEIREKEPEPEKTEEEKEPEYS